MLICKECNEEQETEFRGGSVEYYEHEGRCPACGEYVECVKSCIKKDEEY